MEVTTDGSLIIICGCIEQAVFFVCVEGAEVLC